VLTARLFFKARLRAMKATRTNGKAYFAAKGENIFRNFDDRVKNPE
jgi:hypothetical protein